MCANDDVFLLTLIIGVISGVLVILASISDVLWPWFEAAWREHGAKPRPQARYLDR